MKDNSELTFNNFPNIGVHVFPVAEKRSYFGIFSAYNPVHYKKKMSLKNNQNYTKGFFV